MTVNENGRRKKPEPHGARRRRNSTAAGERPSTIRDVAAKAGVSVATVSRTLAGNYPVSAETRARVMAAVESLHYVVNVHAKALSGRVAGPVALVIKDITGPSLAHVAAGVEQEAADRGRLSLVCATHDDPAREDDLVQLMREQHAAAVVLVGGAVQDEAYQRRMSEYATALDAAGSRLVLVGRPPLPGNLPVTVVGYDNRGGAFQATDHLLTAGHRRVLFLGGVTHLSTSEQRRDGFRHALRAHDVEYREELDLPGPYTRVSGYQRTREALAAGLEFTAVFAGTDMVATGALAALREAGLDVPGDVSLVGFDDVPFAADLSPALTTVRVPYEDLGRTAVRLALEREERMGGDDHVVLSTQLVIRQSVRTLR
ncbi:LacI family transcriptional regulator [Streptomyces ipomoeae]|uniref:Transcriptional regulator, LacI family n=2 Tax=Streptomyces ipomoeae TaxID=103232 RepID=L1KVQ1_9ACTN|nr:transcriptional regulator, LacI family [Streptomyces ipomoeae 91-03]TQE14761.1 LacI family transcriptional regulator [Streptomyces ipomoeae]TQE34753.1 LacI family transcriptional regulator [Streptomyces ipomoeae]TQE36522.1 LacI family transcriptional regulator [Streptomyces ipomoeae]